MFVVAGVICLCLVAVSSGRDLRSADGSTDLPYAPSVPIQGTLIIAVADATTPKVVFDGTDIPQSDVDDSFFIEAGEYSTVSFQYFNDQFVNHQGAGSVYKCYDDFVRCSLSLAVPSHVCAINRPDTYYIGLKTLPSLCDMYLDNCRRGYIFWHAMKFGACGYYDKDKGYVVLYKQG